MLFLEIGSEMINRVIQELESRSSCLSACSEEVRSPSSPVVQCTGSSAFSITVRGPSMSLRRPVSLLSKLGAKRSIPGPGWGSFATSSVSWCARF